MGYTKSCEKELAFQADRRKATTEFIKVINDLWYENDYSHQAIRLAKILPRFVDSLIIKQFNVLLHN